MLDFWIELPWWLRLIIAGAIAAVGVLLCLFVSVRAGYVLTGLGVVMMVVGGRTPSEKNGYRF